MIEVLYLVEIDGEVVAENMKLETATMLSKAIFEAYYKDRKMVVSIKRMDWDKD